MIFAAEIRAERRTLSPPHFEGVKNQRGRACAYLRASASRAGRKAYSVQRRINRGISPVSSSCGRVTESARVGVSSRSLLYARFFYTLILRLIASHPAEKRIERRVGAQKKMAAVNNQN